MITRCCIVAVLLVLLRDCEAILLRNVGVPAYAVEGKDATFICDYDLEGQALYAVKWYKNGLEIYRYLPGNPEPMTTYARPGVKVDVSRSDDRQVTLKNLNMKSTGRYRCEVSTEAPSFATVSSYGDMIIVVLPSSGPKIHGGRPRYRPGDVVNVNCTSRKSKPAADILWFINGEKADESMLIHYPIHNTTHGLHTSTVGLRFVVQRDHFKNGDMKLKCTATIATIYWQSNEKSAEGIKHKRDSAPFFRDEFNRVPDSYSLLNNGSYRASFSEFPLILLLYVLGLLDF